jgi:hypothetical protein
MKFSVIVVACIAAYMFITGLTFAYMDHYAPISCLGCAGGNGPQAMLAFIWPIYWPAHLGNLIIDWSAPGVKS